jgi:hypothetical protein
VNAIDGGTLSSCFAIVSKAGQELNVMMERLENLLKDGIERNKSFPYAICTTHAHSDWPSRDSEDEWVCTDAAFNLPLKLKGSRRRSPDRYVGFQISLLGKGIAIPGNREPLLHVYSWAGDAPIDFEDDNYIGFPFEDVEDGDDGRYQVKAERLMAWPMAGDPTSARSWNYSLRLLALRTEEDLHSYCVAPALKLLGKSAIDEALPDAFLNSGALVRLPDKLILSGEIGQTAP